MRCVRVLVWGLRWDVRERLCGLRDEMCESACVGGDEMVREHLWGLCDRMCGFWSREKKLRFKPQEFADRFGSD